MQTQTVGFGSDISFHINSAEELTQAFRLRDQKKLILPDKIKYPFNVRSYFTWKEPSGVYTYLVFKLPNWDMPQGVAFKRTPSGGEPIGGLCSWCHAYGTSDDIGMLSVAMSSTVSSSYLICHDLSCIEKIEDMAAMSGKSPDKNIDELYYRISKLFENLKNHKAE